MVLLRHSRAQQAQVTARFMAMASSSCQRHSFYNPGTNVTCRIPRAWLPRRTSSPTLSTSTFRSAHSSNPSSAVLRFRLIALSHHLLHIALSRGSATVSPHNERYSWQCSAGRSIRRSDALIFQNRKVEGKQSGKQEGGVRVTARWILFASLNPSLGTLASTRGIVDIHVSRPYSIPFSLRYLHT